MKTLIVPIKKIHGERNAIPLKRLAQFHKGAVSLYDETYLGKEVPYERLLGFYLPPFQRPEVWSISQKSKFIESVFLGFDLGLFVISSNIHNESDGWLIDGQQRMTALRDFIDNKFSIFNDIFYDEIMNEEFDYAGNFYQKETDAGVLRQTPKNHWDTAYFNFLVLKDCSAEILHEAYLRMNYGGTPHT